MTRLAVMIWRARFGRLAVLLTVGTLLGPAACGDRIADVITPNVTSCSATAACPAARPICDSTSLACRGCTSDQECPSSGPARCDSATGQCVSCVTSATCTGPFRIICDPSAHRCVECLTDADCPRSLGTCDLVAGACTLPCGGDMDCFLDFPFCDPGGHLCVECRQDAECADLGLPYCRSLTCTS
jgi:hypothetical protein